jgi:hypothetical protein
MSSLLGLSGTGAHADVAGSRRGSHADPLLPVLGGVSLRRRSVTPERSSSPAVARTTVRHRSHSPVRQSSKKKIAPAPGGAIRKSIDAHIPLLPTSKHLGYYKEGDPAFDEPENMRKRLALRDDERVVTILERFYDTMPRFVQEGSLPKKHVVHLLMLAAKAIYPPSEYSAEYARRIVEEDWRREVGSSEVMPKSAFFSSLFQLADLWTVDIDGDAYAQFLEELYRAVTEEENEANGDEEKSDLNGLGDARPTSAYLPSADDVSVQQLLDSGEDESRGALRQSDHRQLTVGARCEVYEPLPDEDGVHRSKGRYRRGIITALSSDTADSKQCSVQFDDAADPVHGIPTFRVFCLDGAGTLSPTRGARVRHPLHLPKYPPRKLRLRRSVESADCLIRDRNWALEAAMNAIAMSQESLNESGLTGKQLVRPRWSKIRDAVRSFLIGTGQDFPDERSDVANRWSSAVAAVMAMRPSGKTRHGVSIIHMAPITPRLPRGEGRGGSTSKLREMGSSSYSPPRNSLRRRSRRGSDSSGSSYSSHSPTPRERKSPTNISSRSKLTLPPLAHTAGRRSSEEDRQEARSLSPVMRRESLERRISASQSPPRALRRVPAQ